MNDASIELAGLSRPLVEVSGWQAPGAARAAEDLLVWIPGGQQRHVGPKDWQVLSQFWKLQDATPDQIAAFARKWGVLDLCVHGVPRGRYSPLAFVQEQEDSGPGHRAVNCPRRAQGDCFVESMATWRVLASEAHALVEATAQIKLGKRIDQELWDRLNLLIGTVRPETPQARYLRNVGYRDPESGTTGIIGPPKLTFEVEHPELWMITRGIQRWLDMGNVHMKVEWDKATTPFVVWGADNLIGALATQLASMVAGTRIVAPCSHCSNPYVLDPIPSRGVRRYCEECRKAGRPQKDARRDSVLRKKANEGEKWSG